ncbi:MAG: ATP-binding protein [Spirochaetaceae bacterium]|nr:ATP-binding protein [Spirochaetaceae bacterium]
MLERTIIPYITHTSKDFPVVLVTGPRRVGKSVLLSMIQEEKRKYVTLDNLDDRKLAVEDPAMFLQKYAPPIIIDEVQYAPELFTYIKIWVDNQKTEYLINGKKSANPAGAFWLTGSQKYRLMKGIQESLAGRIAIIDMLGFSHKEAKKKPFESKPFYPSMDMMHRESTEKLKLMDVYKLIWKGSFPEMYTKKNMNRDEYFRSYIQTYIERDVKDFQGISNELKFLAFVRAVAVRTGNLINYNGLANDCDIDLRTAQIWMNTLQRSGLVYLLPPYSPNITKRIIKTPKVYFLDTGLASYLARIDTPQALEASYLAGSMLETYAFIEILKSFWHNGLDPLIYFYRDTNQKEIDFILEKNMTLYPVEVKKTTLPSQNDTKNFGVLKQLEKKIGTGSIICLSSNFSPLPKQDIIAVPIWEI